MMVRFPRFWRKGALFCAVLCLLTAYSVSAQVSPKPGRRFALIIGGIGGEEAFTKKYLEQTQRMYNLLVERLQYQPANILYLFEDPALDSVRITGRSTAAEVKKAVRRLARELKPEDQLFVFMVGHGTFDGRWSKFNLVGPDLRDLDYAELLSRLPTDRIILVNTSSASGPFIKRISNKERVIVTATKTGLQNQETHFADFFIDAFASDAADINKDKRVSLAEAFRYARVHLEKWYGDKRRLAAEKPLLDDNGDGEGSPKLENAADGLWARRVYLAPVSQELEAALQKSRSGVPQSPREKLLFEKLALEQKIEDLKARKSQLTARAYT
ncbi:MAG: hypothetical protein D6743_19165, partial [Calditrichaeota bacterium]